MELIIKLIYKIIACHLIGDYVFQTAFLATTKGRNWYHLLIHCFLYTVPFAICFGLDWRILVLFLVHVPLDAGKARWKNISYAWDQVIHLYLAAILYILL